MLETAVINYDSGLTLGSKEMKQQGSIWVQILNTNFDNSAESEERKEMNDREGRTMLETAVIKSPSWDSGRTFGIKANDTARQHFWAQILNTNFDNSAESEER